MSDQRSSAAVIRLSLNGGVGVSSNKMEKYQYYIFAQYCVCSLGAYVDRQHGLVTGFTIDKLK